MLKIKTKAKFWRGRNVNVVAQFHFDKYETTLEPKVPVEWKSYDHKAVRLSS